MLGFLNEYKIYFVCAGLALALVFVSYENDVKKAQIEALNIELDKTISANKTLVDSIEFLKRERESADNAVRDSIVEKQKLSEAVNELKKEVYVDTRDFIVKSNAVIERLWGSEDTNY